MLKNLSSTLLACLFLSTLFAQNTPISGIVNKYTAVNYLDCDSIAVANSVAFSPGDRVLLIQMKGASPDTANTTAFGNVLNYHVAGNFEFGTIASINGNGIILQKAMVKAYDPAALVQLVKVPMYANATVVSPLSAAPWNGSTGGILAIEVSGTLQLNADIDASDLGFRGSFLCTNSDGGCGAQPPYLDYSYPISSGLGAEKGEGIAIPNPIHNGGRGAWANGGGGGNKHNSGGGGGGNFSHGGLGGNIASFCVGPSLGGIGGNDLDYTLGRIFMGGGGGSPDHNNHISTPGGNGGGIVIIRAGTLTSGGSAIRSNGGPVAVIPNGIGDGAGGGGAGGTILLDVNSYGSPLTVEANGSDGGDVNTTWNGCFGPGGGGGVGAILFTQASTPAGVSPMFSEGQPGVNSNSTSPCYLQTWSAMPGTPASGLGFNFAIPQGTDPCAHDTCATVGPTAVFSYSLAGNTLSLTDQSFGPITYITAYYGDGVAVTGNPGQSFNHTYQTNGTYTLCLKATNVYAGKSFCDDDTCIVIQVPGTTTIGETLENILYVFPNPTSDLINIRTDPPLGHLELTLTDMLGRKLAHLPKASSHGTQIDISSLSKGIYLLQIQSKNQVVTRRIRKD